MPRRFRQDAVKLPNGLEMHYHEWPGQQPTLIFLHPSLGYGRMWEFMAEAMGDRFHIYAPDQRGHGRTDKVDGDYSAQEYAEDLVIFMQELGIDRAVLVGHSLGGRVAQVFAARYPQRVSALGLIAGPHLSNFYGTRDSARSVLEGAYGTISHPDEFGSKEEAYAFMRPIKPFTHDPDAALHHRIEHNYVHTDDGRLIPRYDKIRVAQGLVHLSYNLRPYAARVECPVLILRASLGAALTREQADEIARFWRNAHVVDVEGHYALQLENPAGAAKAITTFLSNAGVL
ncbi:alpha/beta fold hydrolase [Bradyrhizobium neotropicale]|uniref:Alpha/beta hydrolase n=1 Tax=Bradyrhizobium neotropicale TaxID=1497615 RepID=A0A176ZES7_9BRAD|nr:alpha/beta hydrolase [Bradyrhizobium neotropicale]OAF19181.1 alpha/beta hydrolase [Bradyrhizobium neotropicale]